MSIEGKPDMPSLYAAGAALVRLQNTFQASVVTIKCGLHFEAAALERIIFEQLAWIFYIYIIKEIFFNFSYKVFVTT